MNLFTLIIIMMILAVWILQAITVVLSSRGAFTWKTGLNFLASACLIIGALGFFGAGFSAGGRLNWLPNTFEWPIGKAENVLITSDGTYIVPHTPSGRIQIYNSNLKFQRGWPIEAYGGVFDLSPSSNTEFYVYTGRGSQKYHYDIYGKLLSAETYKPDEYSAAVFPGQEVEIPTPVYLSVFTHPYALSMMATIGMLLLSIGKLSNKVDSGKK